MKIFIVTLVLVVVQSTWALEIGNPVSVDGLKDQFGNATEVKPETQFVIFVSEKPASKLFIKVIKDEKVDLDSKPVMYVSDISKMPTMITKMFALPKMKKIGFKMVLDREGKVTKDWPKQSKSVTVLTLKDKAVSKIDYLDDEEKLKVFLQAL